MKQQIIIIVILSIVNQIWCDCGCLKCSKDLQVISPPYFPYKVIVKGGPCGGVKPVPPTLLPTTLPQVPSYIPITPSSLDYQLGLPCQVYAYKYKLQAPLPPPPPPASLPLTGLVAKPDRLVIQQTQNFPDCPVYTGNEDDTFRLPCRSIFTDGIYGAPVPSQPLVVAGQPNIHPILQPITGDLFKEISCECRYDNTRKKRELPILRKSIKFFMGLLPMFLRIPIEETLRGLKGDPRPKKVLTMKPSETFLQKLQRLNRVKRSLVFGGDKLSLPFLKVTDVENGLDASEEEEDSEERVDRKQFLKPLNFDHMVPHNPIFYFLNTPIRLLYHFHKFGQQFSPVFKSVPHVFINSRKFFRNFGKNLKNDVLDFASDLIGDFDPIDAHSHRYKYRRYKRHLDKKLEQYEPDYSLVFENKTEANSRRKRYILKVVDEDEVEQFLREKFGGLVPPPEPKKKKKEKDGKKRLVVEQLEPKLIIDNNGRPFVEINGGKRPLFFNKKQEPEEEEKSNLENEQEDTNEDMKEKINSIILKARQRVGNPVEVQKNVPNQMIKDRINQILTEIQDLINLDFNKYSKIHSDLCKLQSFKELLETEWKKILMEDKTNDISSKIRLLDEFKEMQILRDQSVEDIASALSTGSTFMTKKLIKMLVRLQKLQCIIYRVVEDFGERIKMGTEFDVRKEIKYVDHLASLHFIVGRTQHDLECDLKKERDLALEHEMKVLENLRKLHEEGSDPHKMYEEAQLLWEIKNIDKLQKDTILEMNGKISRGLKVRKELKILFDLLRQLEICDEKQKKLFAELVPNEEEEEVGKKSHKSEDVITKFEETRVQQKRSHPKERNRHSGRNFFRKSILESANLNTNRNRHFPHKTILEDKKPVKLVSNGYVMTAYKVSDGFD